MMHWDRDAAKERESMSEGDAVGRPESDEREIREALAAIDLMMKQDGYGSDKAWVVVRDAVREYADFLGGFNDADLIAAVRSGVESGTIEGKVVRWCEVHADRIMPWLEEADQNVCRWAVKVNGEKDCRIVSKLLIPVSDGYKPPNRKGVRHEQHCLHDEPGVTVCTCIPVSDGGEDRP